MTIDPFQIAQRVKLYQCQVKAIIGVIGRALRGGGYRKIAFVNGLNEITRTPASCLRNVIIPFKGDCGADRRYLLPIDNQFAIGTS